MKASAESEELRSIDTARKVAKVLKTDISPESLRNAITTNVGAQTFFVQITASWDEAEFAADLVNAYADVSIRDENSQLKEILDTSVEELQPIAKGRLTDDNGNLNLSVFNARNQLGEVSRLKSLVDEGVVRAAEVGRTGEVPGGPSSPQTARNTVLGLVVGLAIGLLVAFAQILSTDAYAQLPTPIWSLACRFWAGWERLRWGRPARLARETDRASSPRRTSSLSGFFAPISWRSIPISLRGWSS